MRARSVSILTAACLATGILAPRVALARQSADPAATAGIDARKSLRLPASLFLGDATDRADQAQQVTPPPRETPQGAAPAPKAVYANQAAQPFQPTKLTKMVLYGLQLTFYEHVMRIATQEFTRQQLEGKFWPDYFDSVHVPDQWGDKDHWQVNYIGHAISGGAFARIWIEQRERKATTASQYMKGMGRALIYTTIFSIQYEVGPMSEASIGNVGLNPDDLGWSDYVWTSIGGILWTMAEDAADKYVLTYIDKHVPFVMAKAAARMILNPSRMLANIGMNRTPWSRYDRTMTGQPTGR
jgi:hypothetical protein